MACATTSSYRSRMPSPPTLPASPASPTWLRSLCKSTIACRYVVPCTTPCEAPSRSAPAPKLRHWLHPCQQGPSPVNRSLRWNSTPPTHPTDPKRSPKSSVAATSASVSTVPTRTTLSPSALLDPTLLVLRIQPTSTQPHPRHPARHPRCPRPNRQNLLRPRCHGATIPCLHRSFTRARQTTQKSRDRYCAPYIGPDAGALHSRRGLAHACSTPPRPRLDLCQVLVPARSHSCSHRFWCYPRLHPSRPRRPSLALARPTPHPARYQDHRRPLVVYGPRRQIRHCPTQHQLFLPPVSFRNRAHGFFPPCLGVPVAT